MSTPVNPVSSTGAGASPGAAKRLSTTGEKFADLMKVEKSEATDPDQWKKKHGKILEEEEEKRTNIFLKEPEMQLEQKKLGHSPLEKNFAPTPEALAENAAPPPQLFNIAMPPTTQASDETTVAVGEVAPTPKVRTLAATPPPAQPPLEEEPPMGSGFVDNEIPSTPRNTLGQFQSEEPVQTVKAPKKVEPSEKKAQPKTTEEKVKEDQEFHLATKPVPKKKEKEEMPARIDTSSAPLTAEGMAIQLQKEGVLPVTPESSAPGSFLNLHPQAQELFEKMVHSIQLLKSSDKMISTTVITLSSSKYVDSALIGAEIHITESKNAPGQLNIELKVPPQGMDKILATKTALATTKTTPVSEPVKISTVEKQMAAALNSPTNAKFFTVNQVQISYLPSRPEGKIVERREESEGGMSDKERQQKREQK